VEEYGLAKHFPIVPLGYPISHNAQIKDGLEKGLDIVPLHCPPSARLIVL
jgi:hypothetical protein